MEGNPLTTSLTELIALRSKAGKLALHARRSSKQLQSGGFHAPFRGRGMEYAESRPYTLGDDARHVDWRVSARSGQLHSKLFHPERDRVSAVVVDCSPAMAFATRGSLKSVQAAKLAATFVWHAVAQGDRVTADSFPGAAGPLRATGGERGALRCLQAMVAWQSAARNTEPDSARGLERSLQRLARQLRSGAHLLVLLDARSVTDSALKRLRAEVKRHDVVACVLVDPLEVETLPLGQYPVAVESTSNPRPADALDFQVQLIARAQRALTELKTAGVRTCFVRTDQDVASPLAALLSGRNG